MNSFVHLRVHSAYSLSEGAMHPDAIVKLTRAEEMPAVAMTDTNNLFGALEFSKAASSSGIQPILGCVLHLEYEKSTLSSRTVTVGAPVLAPIVLLAKDDVGFKHLLELVSAAHLANDGIHLPHVSMDFLARCSEGLIALTGGIMGPLGRLLLEGRASDAESFFHRLCSLFPDRLYVEIQRHGLPEEEATEAEFLGMAYRYHVPIVATNDVYFGASDMFDAHDALLCVASGRYVVEENRRRLTPDYFFKSAALMRALFSDLPEACDNTVVIAQRCAVMAKGRDPILPSFPCSEGQNEEEELSLLAQKGLEMRLSTSVFVYGETAEERAPRQAEYEERLRFELSVITRMRYSGYFLIVSDFIRWSKRHGIPVGPGRGSGAGSLVAWALEITDLDPIRFGLLFERFLNPERVSMPDFDIDFCQERRDEVISYVQERYGKDRVAQIITFGKLQARAVLRDVGRVLQIPYGKVDKLCKLIPFNPLEPVTLAKAISMDASLKAARDEDKEVERLIDYGLKLEGLYRHASTHAAGVVIADRPLQELIPVYRDPRSEMPVTGYSMKYAEMAGLVKFDFLGLKTLTVIDKASSLIRKHTSSFDVARISLNDRPTYEMLSHGDSMGVFQLESAGMRDTLRKLRPDTIEDIIALISLYRPGPMDNIPTYIARKHGNEAPDYLHPMLKDILRETFGVIIYQEQVMQIAQVLAGYSLGGADLLRRAMGKKIAAEMIAQRELFVSGAVKNGVDREQASGIFDLVAKFAGYGFNKSHAAAYALISYQTAFLKANYPVEFLAASMNLELHDTDKLNLFIQEAKQQGIVVLPPDVNHSFAWFVPEASQEHPRAIRYALGALKNVGVAAMEAAVDDRETRGPFTDVFDATSRIGMFVNRRQLEQLVRAGAFDMLHANRQQLFQHVEMLMQIAARKVEEKKSTQVSLFGNDAVFDAQKPKFSSVADWQLLEKLAQEYEAVGFYLREHPLQSYQALLKRIKILSFLDASDAIPHGFSKMKLAGIITAKKIRSSAKGRYATLMVSDPSAVFEVAVYNEVLLHEQRDLLENGMIVVMDLDVRKDEGGMRLMAERLMRVEDALAHLRSHLRITLRDSEALVPLKASLSKMGKGKTQLSVVIPASSFGRVEISLPDSYHLLPSLLSDLHMIEGVQKVEEVG